MKNLLFVLVLLCFISCKQKDKTEAATQGYTSGNLDILVDESVGPIVQKEMDIFSLDYPKATFSTVFKPEQKIITSFLNDSIRVIVLPRMLTKEEEKFYQQRNIRINTLRFAIDGIALITNKDNIDSTINVIDVIDVLQGKKTNRKLIFDNAYSSTFHYFKDLAKIKEFPKQGVYSKNSSNEVIRFVAENKDFIGILGVNWLSENNTAVSDALAKVRVLGVKNTKGGIGDDNYYKPTQQNLINGVYPFLRNINIINCEGRGGLGTGFSVWLTSQRGQLLVLKSGLAPHKLMPREINVKKE